MVIKRKSLKDGFGAVSCDAILLQVQGLERDVAAEGDCKLCSTFVANLVVSKV